MVNLRKQLGKLLQGLDEAIQRGDPFEVFVKGHLDELETLRHLPMKFRELPIFFSLMDYL